MKRIIILLVLILILVTSCTHPAYKDEVYFGDIYSHGVLLTPGGASTWGSITGTLSAQTDLNSALSAKQSTSEKGAVSGYAGLGTNSLVPTAQLATGAASSSTYLRGDQTWATVGAGTELDPVWSASPSYLISAGDILN